MTAPARCPGWRAAVLACLAAAGTVSCGVDEPADSDLAARVGDEELAYAEFESYLIENSVDPEQGWGSDVLSALFDQFLDEELLRLLAVERGLAAPDAGRRLAAERLLDEVAEVEEPEIAAYYRRHRARFERPERARVRQILLPDREAAERARADLLAGASFEQLAQDLAQAPTGVIGDSDAALAASDLPPAFAEAIFALAPGEVSEPVATDYGFHLFQVVELLPAGAAPLSSVAAEIGDRLRREKAESTLTELVAEARRRYNVQVFSRNLPFNYQGLYSDGPPAGS